MNCHRILTAAVILIFSTLPVLSVKAEDEVLRRTVLAIVDLEDEKDIRFSRIHRIAEMPLNHLGLRVRYIDVSDPLPPLSEMQDVRGILTWFKSDRMPNPGAFIDWAVTAVESDRKLVILGDPAVYYDSDGKPTSLAQINRLLGLVGIQTQRDWLSLTYDVAFTRHDPELLDFERPMQGVLPPFDRTKRADERASVHLTARRSGDPETDSDLIVISDRGGYAAGGYIYHVDPRTGQPFWHLDPFEFFRRTYQTDDLPKPDATTLAGNRIYYSHIDGDGWRNVSEIAKYKERRTLASEVLLKEVFEKYPELPVTVGPVAADLDPAWAGTEETQQIARDIFALDHIEAGTHTYSHPFNWRYFEDYDEDQEQSLVGSNRTGDTVISRINRVLAGGSLAPDADTGKSLTVPRAFFDRPFDIDQEVGGSIAFIERFLPSGKKVELFQWSGDTSPGTKSLQKVIASGLPNINGGDSRFDREFPSYASVAPVGLLSDDGLQVYASNSNENTYTDLWRGRYFGFLHLVRTIKNTETPVRVKPFNVYYHMYSGEKESSLNALLRNIEYAKTNVLIPIEASRFAKIAEGFFTSVLTKIDGDRWRVENRGALQTVRFDHATLRSVDFSNSRGVIGQRHLQGSLYVSLDPNAAEIVIALKDDDRPDVEAGAAHPYLISSTWSVRDVAHSNGRFEFTARGYGRGDLTWRVPYTGRVLAVVNTEKEERQVEFEVDANGELNLRLLGPAIEGVRVSVRQVSGE